MSEPTEEIIRPSGFTPSTAATTRRSRISPLTIAAGAVLFVVLGVIWFLFTAKSVRLTFAPNPNQVTISGGISFELSGIYLLREGAYHLSADADGHHPISASFDVGAERNQTFDFEFEKLPGLISFTSTPLGATVSIDGAPMGVTPMADLEVAAGDKTITLSLDRYQPFEDTLGVAGMHQQQTFNAALQPDWGTLDLATEPPGAQLFIDEEETPYSSPGIAEILSGKRVVRLKKPGFKSHTMKMNVTAGEHYPSETIKLKPADGLVYLRSRPNGAGVTVNGQYQGTSPIELNLEPNRTHSIQIFMAGFSNAKRTIRLASGQEDTLDIALQRLTGLVSVQVQPASAEVLVNGRSVGTGSQQVTLPTTRHVLEVKLDGYAGYKKQITPRPGLTQELKVKLLTLSEARLAALKPEIVTSQKQVLALIKPPASAFTTGASRREPGRRANEVLREIQLTKNFYLAKHEVTNAQFKAFDANHDSDFFEDLALNKADQPVVRVSWRKAALYCNWLSQKDALPVYYQVDGDNVVGVNPESTGYRLPSEAEWTWAAQGENPTRFPWGTQLPPPDRHGNYADRSAAHLVGRIVFGYNDNHIVAATVGTFPVDHNGLHDMAGNVAEWTGDFYSIPEAALSVDPMGAATGEYRVIKGSSWMHGTITDLRVSFRDYGDKGREDVGFRIARFAERI